MILDAARAAAADLLSPGLRGVLVKSLGLTLLALAALWFAIRGLFDWLAWPFLDSLLPGLPSWAGWLGFAAAILAGIGLAVALAMLVAPVTAAVANFFLDDAAEIIEKADYPGDSPGQLLPLGRSLVLSAKFFGVVILGNLLALVLLLVPGVNLAAFFLVNGYLLGREFFEFAAMRHLGETEAKALRRRHGFNVFLGGLVIAGFLAVPVINLAAPLFGAALMIHLFKMLPR